MKILKFALIVLILIFLMGLFIFTSDYYLISGSDVVDFSYHFPNWLHAVIASAIIFLLVVDFFRKRKRYTRILIGLFLLLGLLSSQALVVSGKSNAIMSYCFGVRTGLIAFDPGVGYQSLVKTSKYGYTTISDKKHSSLIISGFCPVCINLDSL